MVNTINNIVTKQNSKKENEKNSRSYLLLDRNDSKDWRNKAKGTRPGEHAISKT